MIEKLEGEHIVLRKAVLEDWASMLRHVWSDERVYRWMLFTPTLTEEDAIARCKRSIEFQKTNYGYFVALKDTNEAIGLCAVREYAPGRYEECGICIGAAFQGKGYGKEILALLLELCFDHLHAVDFQYGYFADNLRSKALAQHFGFRYNETEHLVRPWDKAEKEIELCLLSRREYENYKAKYGK